jgi:hypothetical protein
LREWYHALVSEADTDRDLTTKLPVDFTVEFPQEANFTNMRALLLDKIKDGLTKYEDMEKLLPDEQSKMLDEMKKLYIKAKEVGEVIGTHNNRAK